MALITVTSFTLKKDLIICRYLKMRWNILKHGLLLVVWNMNVRRYHLTGLANEKLPYPPHWHPRFDSQAGAMCRTWRYLYYSRFVKHHCQYTLCKSSVPCKKRLQVYIQKNVKKINLQLNNFEILEKHVLTRHKLCIYMKNIRDNKSVSQTCFV